MHYEYVFDEGSGLYRQITEASQYSVVFASEAHAALLSGALPRPCVCVTSAAALVRETAKQGAIAFVDCDLLDQLDGAAFHVPIVGILREAAGEVLPRAVRLLDTFPKLSHCVTASMLSTPLARSHLSMVVERLASGREQMMLGEAGIGRVAMLASASRREERFDRMRDFFSKQGLSTRTILTVTDVVEELVTNALYDAPVEAGFFKKAVPRTEDVDLPPERACEISYGIEAGNIFLRIRDTFGALTRARLLSVLNRCSTDAVALDESRGGAGLGMWRVLSAASTISITVVPGRLTEILVRIATKQGRIVAKQLLAVHLYFAPTTHGLATGFADDDDLGMMDQSITLVLVA